jgi:hypothetical protein
MTVNYEFISKKAKRERLLGLRLPCTESEEKKKSKVETL